MESTINSLLNETLVQKQELRPKINLKNIFQKTKLQKENVKINSCEESNQEEQLDKNQENKPQNSQKSQQHTISKHASESQNTTINYLEMTQNADQTQRKNNQNQNQKLNEKQDENLLSMKLIEDFEAFLETSEIMVRYKDFEDNQIKLKDLNEPVNRSFKVLEDFIVLYHNFSPKELELYKNKKFINIKWRNYKQISKRIKDLQEILKNIKLQDFAQKLLSFIKKTKDFNAQLKQFQDKILIIPTNSKKIVYIASVQEIIEIPIKLPLLENSQNQTKINLIKQSVKKNYNLESESKEFIKTFVSTKDNIQTNTSNQTCNQNQKNQNKFIIPKDLPVNSIKNDYYKQPFSLGQDNNNIIQEKNKNSLILINEKQICTSQIKKDFDLLNLVFQDLSLTDLSKEAVIENKKINYQYLDTKFDQQYIETLYQETGNLKLFKIKKLKKNKKIIENQQEIETHVKLLRELAEKENLKSQVKQKEKFFSYCQKYLFTDQEIEIFCSIIKPQLTLGINFKIIPTKEKRLFAEKFFSGLIFQQ